MDIINIIKITNIKLGKYFTRKTVKINKNI